MMEGPNITMAQTIDVKMIAAAVKPMCQELGKEQWWTRLAVAKPQEVAKNFPEIITAGMLTTGTRPIPVRNRNLTWRTEAIQDARFAVLLTVPRTSMEASLQKSGSIGITIDLDDREDMELTTERLPREWDSCDINKRVAALPQHIRKMTYGIVPSKYGCAIRLRHADRLEVIKALKPNKAQK